MKMRPEHFAALKAAIEPLDTQERRTRYERGEFFNADICRDLYKRYRWDLLYIAKVDTGPLYTYLDDTHIDTALRAIVEQGAWFHNWPNKPQPKMRCPACGGTDHTVSTSIRCPCSAASGM